MGEGNCSEENGCFCSKRGEIWALIHSLIEPQYREANIFSFTGKMPGEEEYIEGFNGRRVRSVLQSLKSYMYGDENKINKNMTRSDLNRLSILDKRLRTGTNLIIHGKSKSNERQGRNKFLSKHMPSGKTLIASIVMIDAINRKAFCKKPISFDWISFLKMQQHR